MAMTNRSQWYAGPFFKLRGTEIVKINHCSYNTQLLVEWRVDHSCRDILVHQNEKRQGETQSHCSSNGKSRQLIQGCNIKKCFTVVVTEWLGCSILNSKLYAKNKKQKAN
jgi:hypothetical protein